MGDLLQKLNGRMPELYKMGEECLSDRRRRIIEQTQKRITPGGTELFRIHVSNDRNFSPMRQSGNFLFAHFNFLRVTREEKQFATY